MAQVSAYVDWDDEDSVLCTGVGRFSLGCKLSREVALVFDGAVVAPVVLVERFRLYMSVLFHVRSSLFRPLNSEEYEMVLLRFISKNLRRGKG